MVIRWCFTHNMGQNGKSLVLFGKIWGNMYMESWWDTLDMYFMGKCLNFAHRPTIIDYVSFPTDTAVQMIEKKQNRTFNNSCIKPYIYMQFLNHTYKIAPNHICVRLHHAYIHIYNVWYTYTCIYRYGCSSEPHMYIYIHLYIYTYIHIHIYIYT